MRLVGEASRTSRSLFFFAEVMKYSYLIHAPEAEWQVSKDGKNAWVFNTEAHPFKVFGRGGYS